MIIVFFLALIFTIWNFAEYLRLSVKLKTFKEVEVDGETYLVVKVDDYGTSYTYTNAEGLKSNDVVW
jgi:hypothetical protein